MRTEVGIVSIVLPMPLNLRTPPVPDPRNTPLGTRGTSVQLFGTASARLAFFDRKSEGGRRRGGEKSLLRKLGVSFIVASRRRTIRSVKSSSGGRASAKSRTAASVEKRAWFALAPLTAPATADRRPISNSSSWEFRHSVTPSE